VECCFICEGIFKISVMTVLRNVINFESATLFVFLC
jgi:hypothetical protein